MVQVFQSDNGTAWQRRSSHIFRGNQTDHSQQLNEKASCFDRNDIAIEIDSFRKLIVINIFLRFTTVTAAC